jgi:hypothetical protein
MYLDSAHIQNGEKMNFSFDDGFSVQERGSASNIVGRMIKFQDGLYKLDKTEIVSGSSCFIVNAVITAWVRWENKKLVEHRVTKAGQVHPERDELGDLDQNQWPAGLNDEPDDPWKDTRYVHLIDQKTGADLTFVTDNFGGRRAVMDLKGQIRQHPQRSSAGAADCPARQRAVENQVRKPAAPLIHRCWLGKAWRGSDSNWCETGQRRADQ